MSFHLNALITILCETAQIFLKRCFHFPFASLSAYNARQIPGEWFQRLEDKKPRTTFPLSRWAVTQAHFLLHAHLMSPILSACHILFCNTGLTPRRCAPGARFPYPSQLKD
ncbi:protein YnhH [Enterobacter cancerogenus]|uniref:protein YnhH n=1 Tax=Enterobacter cancerogenus TaxID=69218 RepID=UPI003F679D5C